MVKKVLSRNYSLDKILVKAGISSEFVEVLYVDGVVVIQPKNLKCAMCGCDNETKLVSRNGIYICKDCLGEALDFLEKTEELPEEYPLETEESR